MQVTTDIGPPPMTSLTEFLFPAPAPRTVRAILGWWESRRLAYNAMVGSAGLVSVGAIMSMSLLFGDAVHPEQAIIPITVFGVMANVCYLLGPVTEIVIQKLWGNRVLPTGPSLFRIGLTFSVGLALFPTLLVAIMTVVRTVAIILGYA
jgi:hypothetical protein